MNRPNILFIMADQFRWDAVGPPGHWVETPNLDRIAEEGVIFSNCVTTSPVCIPARVSLATGLYPHNLGLWNNTQYTLPEEMPTWMRCLRDAGYQTSLFGKTHLHPHQGDLRDREFLLNAYGLDHVNEIGGPRAGTRVLSYMTEEWEKKGLWEPYRQDFAERFKTKPHMVRPSPLGLDHYYDVYVGKKAKEYIQRYDANSPWFCWLSFGGPHEPWDAPEPYASRYDPANMPRPLEKFRDMAERSHGLIDGRKTVSFDPGDAPSMRANYAGEVSLIDHMIGEVFSTIEERGEWDRTIVIFTSDHGEMNGDHGLIYKQVFLDGAVRVPLLVRTPETAASPLAGSTCRAPTELFDVGPTLLELARVPSDYPCFARSFSPALSDPEHWHRSEAVSELAQEMMVLTPGWKMAVNTHGKAYMLFDVKNDPQESRNLAGLPQFKAIETDLMVRLCDRYMRTS